MTPREEHIEKIKETKRLLSDPNISEKRSHDLKKYLARLRKELKCYDMYKRRENGKIITTGTSK